MICLLGIKTGKDVAFQTAGAVSQRRTGDPETHLFHGLLFTIREDCELDRRRLTNSCRRCLLPATHRYQKGSCSPWPTSQERRRGN